MKWSSLTFLSKALITLAAAGAVGAAVYFLSPTVTVCASSKVPRPLMTVTWLSCNNLSYTHTAIYHVMLHTYVAGYTCGDGGAATADGRPQSKAVAHQG